MKSTPWWKSKPIIQARTFSCYCAHRGRGYRESRLIAGFGPVISLSNAHVEPWFMPPSSELLFLPFNLPLYDRFSFACVCAAVSLLLISSHFPVVMQTSLSFVPLRLRLPFWRRHSSLLRLLCCWLHKSVEGLLKLVSLFSRTKTFQNASYTVDAAIPSVLCHGSFWQTAIDPWQL